MSAPDDSFFLNSAGREVRGVALSGYGEKVSRELPKLKLRVRFSLPAPHFSRDIFAISDRRIWARHYPFRDFTNGSQAVIPF